MRARLESVVRAAARASRSCRSRSSRSTLTLGRRGRLLRRVAPGRRSRGSSASSQLLWAADEQREFDLRAATRGTLLSTQAATLAALRRVERARRAGSRRDGATAAARAARLDRRAALTRYRAAGDGGARDHAARTPLVIVPTVHGDERGFFQETYRRDALRGAWPRRRLRPGQPLALRARRAARACTSRSAPASRSSCAACAARSST